MSEKFKLKLLIFLLLPWLYFNTSLSAGLDNSEMQKTEKIVNVEIFKKNGDFRIDSISIDNGEFHYRKDYQAYKNKIFNGRVASFKNMALGFFSLSSNLAAVECEDYFDKEKGASGGCFEFSEGNILVQLPYFPNGKYADIYDLSGKKVLTIDLSSKATCNENDKCDQPIEDSENCPQDCKNQESKLDPVVVEKAQETSAESEKISVPDFSWWALLAGIVLLAIGGGIGYYIWRKNKEYL